MDSLSIVKSIIFAVSRQGPEMEFPTRVSHKILFFIDQDKFFLPRRHSKSSVQCYRHRGAENMQKSLFLLQM